MPKYDFRKGAESIADAQERAKNRGGDFTPFAPLVYWTQPEKDEDNSERYVLFLNELSDMPQVDLITYIEKEREKSNGDTFTTFESAIARTDAAIGEDSDPMSDEWNANPRETNIGVAVVLDPVIEEDDKKRKRVRGFKVQTTEFDRRVRDDEGELTDETETVQAPVVGYVQQSPHNFWNLISSIDSSLAPIETIAIKVKRLDDKTYQAEAEAYLDFGVDLVPLIDTITNLSYVSGKEDREALEAIIAENEDDDEAAIAIGNYLLDKYLDELANAERYDELFEGISKPFKYGKKKGKGSAKESKSTSRQRPARRSQRRSTRDEAEVENETPEPATSDEPTEEPVAEEKPKARRGRPKKTEEPKAEAEESSSEKDRVDKLAALRQRSRARKEKATA